MPSTLDELVLELPPEIRPRLVALGVRGQMLHNTAQEYACDLQQSARALLGAVVQFETGWQFLCREALEGRIVDMQPVRDYFLKAIEDRLRLLGEAHELLKSAERIAQRELPEVAQLRHEWEVLGKKLRKLWSRWHTAEDLEDLAAESLAPSTDKLEAVRRKHGYPQAWYDDDSKPF